MNVSNQYTRPNFGFMKQLIKYEYEIKNNNSLTLREFLELCQSNFSFEFFL